jgi:hypothetical protein
MHFHDLKNCFKIALNFLVEKLWSCYNVVGCILNFAGFPSVLVITY